MRRGLATLALLAAACTPAAGSVDVTVEPELTTLPPVTRAPRSADPPTSTLSPTSAAPTAVSPTTTTTVPPEVASSDWYLVWVPVQLPEGFADGIDAIDGVDAVSVVRSGNGFLVETHDRDGVLVDEARPGYVYPVEVHAYADLAVHAEFVGEEIAGRFANLRDDTVMLGETSARVRGVGPGATLTFDSGETVTVAGIIDDAYVGDAEVVTGRPDPEVFGEVRERYLLARFHGDAADLAEHAEALTHEPVVVRRWRDPRVARAGDQVRSQVAFKERFGEFAIRPTQGGFIQDPSWRAEHIVTERIPLLGSVTCHREFVEMLRRVMTHLEETGYGDVIDRSAYQGCYNARFIAGRTDLSHHSWGAAADINFFTPPGRRDSPTHPALLDAMYAAGLTSGHTWNNPDPGHFEWIDDPEGVTDR